MQRRKVYLIDDDPAILRSIALLLSTIGIDAEGFESPAHFLDKLDSLKPAAVITDFRMPEMDGIQLRREIREQSKDWPVVLMTSEPGSITAEKLAAEGFAGFLIKPFSVESLREALGLEPDEGAAPKS